MNQHENCSCVVCEEYGGRVPYVELNEQEELRAEDLPDPFEEVLGG